ncbi:MAG: hypothetical protein Tsb002_03590 [Wenzhouxiangellaceae bacterium]
MIPRDQYPFAARIQTLLHPESFERRAVFDEIMSFIETTSSGYILIDGGAGMGKSWLTAYTAKAIFEAGQYRCAWHFNELASGANSSDDLLRSLYTQLDEQFGLEALNENYQETIKNDRGYAAFYRQLFDHLVHETDLADAPLILLVDALDEVNPYDSSISQSANTQFLPSSLPDNVYLIATSRDFDREVFHGACLQIHLTQDSEHQKRDIAAHIRKQAATPPVQRWIGQQAWPSGQEPQESFLGFMLERSELAFIYLYFVFQHIDEYELDSIPHGIGSYYRQQLSRLYGVSSVKRSAATLVFDAILQFPPMVSVTTIHRYTRLDREVINDVCDPARSIKLITEHPERQPSRRFFSYFHKSFYDFLKQELRLEQRAGRFKNLFEKMKQDFSFGEDQFAAKDPDLEYEIVNVLFALCKGLHSLRILGNPNYPEFDDLILMLINLEFIGIALMTTGSSECQDRLTLLRKAYNTYHGQELITEFDVSSRISRATNTFVDSSSAKILDVLNDL